MLKFLLHAQLTIILFTLLSSPVSATIYLWHDATGTAHYTNRDYEIPPRYISRVKTLYPETAEKPVGQADNTKEQGIPESALKLSTPVLATQPPSDKVMSLPRKKMRRQGRASSNEE